jgi:hypothetical protein
MQDTEQPYLRRERDCRFWGGDYTSAFLYQGCITPPCYSLETEWWQCARDGSVVLIDGSNLIRRIEYYPSCTKFGTATTEKPGPVSNLVQIQWF